MDDDATRDSTLAQGDPQRATRTRPEAFDRHLSDVLGPSSQADAARLYLPGNDAARRSIIPSSILGIGLLTKLHRLDVARSALLRNRVREDCKPLQQFLAASRQALEARSAQLANEYIGWLQRATSAPASKPSRSLPGGASPRSAPLAVATRRRRS